MMIIKLQICLLAIQGTHHFHRIEDMAALDFNRFETLE